MPTIAATTISITSQSPAWMLASARGTSSRTAEPDRIAARKIYTRMPNPAHAGPEIPNREAKHEIRKATTRRRPSENPLCANFGARSQSKET